MEKQSIRIGVDRFFFAPLLADTETSTTYESSIQIPGINRISLKANSYIETLYADDGPYETYSIDGPKQIQVSLAGLSNEIVAKLTGASYNEENGLLVDKNDDRPPYVAIGFRSQKANGEYRYVWIYKGKFAKSDFVADSKSNRGVVNGDEYIFTATMRVSDGAWRRMLDSDDANIPTGATAAILNEDGGWFSSPDYMFDNI